MCLSLEANSRRILTANATPISPSCSQRLLERFSRHDAGCGNDIGNLNPLLRGLLDARLFRQCADALTNAELVPKALVAARRPTRRCAQQEWFGLLRVNEFEQV